MLGTLMKPLLRYLEGTPRTIIIRTAILIAVIALIDWKVRANVYFGFLYIFPMLMAGTVLPFWQILSTAIICTVLSEFFDPFVFEIAVSFPQDIALFITFIGVGLFSRQVVVSHQHELEQRQMIEKEMIARRAAEEQLELIVQSSPIAILVMSERGEILIGNSSAHHLFQVEDGKLTGSNISRYVSELGRVSSMAGMTRVLRTEMQCHAKRENGELFLANIFFSTYVTSMGWRLAAMVVDASEELRDRAEYGLDQLMAGSRLLVGAVSHEVRNVCSAMGVIYQNLARDGVVEKNQDFEALGTLVETLKKMASLDLQKSSNGFNAKNLELNDVLEEARIVLEPYCAESGITVHWNIPEKLPLVWTDRHSLLHVLLNLIRNSRRALEGANLKNIDISVAVNAEIVSISVCDNGPGISSSINLFQPLQKGANAAGGLGLFLSRAFIRSFGGDLRYDPDTPGCCFVIELAIWPVSPKQGAGK